MPLVFYISEKIKIHRKAGDADCNNNFSEAIKDDTEHDFPEHPKNQIQENSSVHINENIRKTKLRKDEIQGGTEI